MSSGNEFFCQVEFVEPFDLGGVIEKKSSKRFLSIPRDGLLKIWGCPR